MYDMDQIKEKVILVGVDTGSEDSVESSLDELAELAGTGTWLEGQRFRGGAGAHRGG